MQKKHDPSASNMTASNKASSTSTSKGITNTSSNKPPSLVGQKSQPPILSTSKPEIKKQISVDNSNQMQQSSSLKSKQTQNMTVSQQKVSQDITVARGQQKQQVSTSQNSESKSVTISRVQQKQPAQSTTKIAQSTQKPAQSTQKPIQSTTKTDQTTEKPATKQKDIQTKTAEIVRQRFILTFKDSCREFNLQFSICESMLMIVEDNNQKEDKRKQYTLDLSKLMYPLLDAINQDETFKSTTQNPINDQQLQNPDSFPSIFYKLLSSPASRKVLFTFLKIKQEELVWNKKENAELLKVCIQNKKVEDKSKEGLYLLEQLGKGGQGEVWLYYDTTQKKTYVFKKFFKRSEEGYLSEKKMLQKLSGSKLCPPLVRFDDEQLMIQSEKGEISLENYDLFIKNSKLPMYPESELIYILKWLVEGVGTLQKKYSLYHCDIKPDNIVLISHSFQKFQIQLIDFGGAVEDFQDYPGCYTPAYFDPKLLKSLDSITKQKCIAGEIYCVARTLCKLALKDPSLKPFCQNPFKQMIGEIGQEYSNLKKILLKICEGELSTVEAVIKETQSIPSEEFIVDKAKVVERIQKEKLQNAQNNMGKQHLLQQIDFYESMYAYEKAIQTINTLLQKYQDWTLEEKDNLMLQLTRLQLKVKGMTGLESIIQHNLDTVGGGKNKYLELLQLVAKDTTEISQIIAKGEEIKKSLISETSYEGFVLNDVIASLLETESKFEIALKYRLENIQIAQFFTDLQIPLYSPSTQLAMCYEHLGLFNESYQFYNIALDSAKSKLSKENPNLSTAYQNISNFLKNISQFEQAEEYQKQSLELRKKGSQEYANSLSNLASIKQKKGLYKEAITIYEESLQDLRTLLGSGHVDVGYALNNMSKCLSELGENKKALNACLEALEIMKQNLGDKHSYIATCCGNIGDCYRHLGEFDKALEYVKKSFDLNDKISGKKSLPISNSYENFGLIYYQKLDYTKAIDNFENSLSILRAYNSQTSKDKNIASFTSQNQQLSVLLNNLALAYEGIFQDEKSLELQLESLQIKKIIFDGQTHPSLAISMGNIGMTLCKLARYKESITYLSQAITILKESGINPQACETYENRLKKARENK